MLQLIKTFALGIGIFSTVALQVAWANEATPPVKDPVFTRKIEERAAKIATTLELKDEEKARRVREAIVAQYHVLNIWHETNDAHLKDLKKIASDKDADKANQAKTEIEAAKATLKAIHDNYLSQLASELSPELVERVKDGMTVGKVQFTYTGYVQQYPTMNDEQKAKVLELLKEAREEAMDAGSMDEKSDIFNRYKGKINNWLSKQGVEQSGRAKKSSAEKNGPGSK